VSDVLVRPMAAEDARAVLRIYQEGIDDGVATFEVAAPTWEQFDAGRLPGHRFVAVDKDSSQVLGWVAVSSVSPRPAYAGVVEHSVYVDRRARGRGVGGDLLRALVRSTEAAGVWTIQSAIFPGNAASARLHERLGFRVVGRRERIARLAGQWQDTVLVERRSRVVGGQ
jgi:L-amino acid N-acyltransferase YncA